MECCAGCGHTIRQGGARINILVLDKRAHTALMAAYDIWLDGKRRLPRALAIVCDRCLADKREPRYSVARDYHRGPIYRVPIAELGDWTYDDEGSGDENS